MILLLNPRDNIGTALVDLEAYTEYTIKGIGQGITTTEKIPFAHKVALYDMKKGDPIYKYGEIIGYALQSIKPGEWVHQHNLSAMYCE